MVVSGYYKSSHYILSSSQNLHSLVPVTGYDPIGRNKMRDAAFSTPFL